MSTPTHLLPQSAGRKLLANVAFTLALLQLILLTHQWWQPYLAQTQWGSRLLSLEHIGLQSATPLTITVREINQHPTKLTYWNIKLDIENKTKTWVSFPHLVLSFLNEKKTVVLRNQWSPQEYLNNSAQKAIKPNEKLQLSLWLILPEHIPSEYNLDYFYPY
ncbi:MAG: DUF3426 domain-containing protein [Pseudomonadota bacterium]